MEEQNYKKVGYNAEDITRLLGLIPPINGNFPTLMNFVMSQPRDGTIYARKDNAWVQLILSQLGTNIFLATDNAQSTTSRYMIIKEEYIMKEGREPKIGDLVLTPNGLMFTIISDVHQSVYIGKQNAYSVDYRAVDLKPVKGKDYFTDSDKKEFVNQVLSSFVDVSKNAQ